MTDRVAALGPGDEWVFYVGVGVLGLFVAALILIIFGHAMGWWNANG